MLIGHHFNGPTSVCPFKVIEPGPNILKTNIGGKQRLSQLTGLNMHTWIWTTLSRLHSQDHEGDPGVAIAHDPSLHV